MRKGNHMDIGKEIRVITVEPIEDPVPRELPVEVPERDTELVPA